MGTQEVFEKQRLLLLLCQLIEGKSLSERTRNLSWIIDLLQSGDTAWDTEELVILGESSAPFMPSRDMVSALTALKILSSNPEKSRYELRDPTDLNDGTLDATLSEKGTLTIAELREVLEGGRSRRRTWNRATLRGILSDTSQFGFHCIQSWRSAVERGAQLSGVPFLWNVASDGHTTPMGDLPASSATVDIVRLAVQPLEILKMTPSDDERILIQWSFDQIYENISFKPDGEAAYYLPGDDSYPNTAYPINDTQARVISLLVHLLSDRQQYLDAERHGRANKAAWGLVRYILGQQLDAPERRQNGFWSFHRYSDVDVDGFQVLTINSELAVRAMEALWPLASATMQADIARGLSRLLASLRQTAICYDDVVGWQKHFSTLVREDVVEAASTRDQAEGASDDCEVFATARAMLIFAIARSLKVADDDATFYVRGALRFLQRNWSVKLEVPQDDIEFISYRSPEGAKWSDMTYRITNPISAIMPYYVLKTQRLCGEPLSVLLAENINNCVNFALENYGGHGFWLDAPTGMAYPTNTAFNLEMLAEYLRASEI